MHFVRAVTSPLGFKGRRNRLYSLMGYDKVVEEQVGLGLLPWLIGGYTICYSHDYLYSSYKHGALGEGGLRESLWPGLHLPWYTHNCTFQSLVATPRDSGLHFSYHSAPNFILVLRCSSHTPATLKTCSFSFPLRTPPHFKGSLGLLKHLIPEAW